MPHVQGGSHHYYYYYYYLPTSQPAATAGESHTLFGVCTANQPYSCYIYTIIIYYGEEETLCCESKPTY
jgi:hypothetical protein